MTQRKQDFSSSPISKNDSNPAFTKCWWSDEVLSNPDPEEQQPCWKDFVLISEFSELEGPLPLAVVSANASYIDLKNYAPEDLQNVGLESFDFNAFVLRVVSVDRSTEYEQIDQDLTFEPSTPSSVFADNDIESSAFSIPDDTQVYFHDSEHDFFAFTHHLTLFDINARGYVHPVALSYITRDPDKIVIRFEELMTRFNEVSIKMKTGNYSNFTLDLKCRLLDLEYTIENNKQNLSVQAIQQAITATKLMIDTLESNSSQIENIPKPDGSSAESSPTVRTSLQQQYVEPPKEYKPKCIDSLYPVPHFERKLRSLAQLCQEPEESEQEQEEESPVCQHVKRPSLSQKTAAMIPLVFSMINTPTSKKQPTFATAIKHDMYSEAIESIQDMTKHLGRSSVILDIEEEESFFVDPISSALTFGRTFILNMDNPQPREEEAQFDTGGLGVKDENALAASADATLFENLKDDRKHQSSSTETDGDDDSTFYPMKLAPFQLWKSSAQPSHLLEILRKYQSLIVDVIFSLMTGRTVLIQGSTQNRQHVEKVVHALSIFVPGQSRDRHQIIDWFGERLRDTQIASIKLVGIDKENMDPSIHIEGSCVLDVDAKNGSLNSSPVYLEGQWINQLLDRIMLFSSDESYLAYLHTMFMTMSLKAFVYHHLYICDEFKLLEDDTSAVLSNKGYTSETGSENGSTLSRKWSTKLLNYLKKHEDQTHDTDTLSRPPSRASSVAAEPSPKYTHQQQEQREEEEDYSEENQATVTLHNLLLHQKQQQHQQQKPRTIVGLFGATPSVGEPIASTTNATASSTTHSVIEIGRDSMSTNYSRRNSTDSSESLNNHSPRNGIPPYLNFDVAELEYFGQDDIPSSSSEEEAEEPKNKGRRRKYRSSRKMSDIGPDGVSYTERRGRRYLQEKLKVYGDDQTIIVYLATCVL